MSNRARILRNVIIILAIGGASYYAFKLARFEALKRGYVQYNEWDQRVRGKLRRGDVAPDIELARLDGTGTVRFSQLYAERPLVLFFGSYT